VAAPVERAFATFSDGLAGWWPREYTWAQDTLETIAIEPREGGRCFERGPHGFHCDWGRVLAWDPPDRLAFTWQIGPDRVPEPNPWGRRRPLPGGHGLAAGLAPDPGPLRRRGVAVRCPAPAHEGWPGCEDHTDGPVTGLRPGGQGCGVQGRDQA
jgi:uncharacterized protein YndB with AHSA1/START domain